MDQATPVAAGVEGLPGRDEAAAMKNGRLLAQIEQPLWILSRNAQVALEPGTIEGPKTPLQTGDKVLGYIAEMPMNRLGNRHFRQTLGLQYACVAGAMANGIASVPLVKAMTEGGMTGFFGAAGLPPVRVAQAVSQLKSSVGDRPFGVNLIHSPNEPMIEKEVGELLIREQVHLVEASAFLRLTKPIVRYRLAGIKRDADGRIQVPNQVMAKVSRVEVATQFMSPAPEKFISELLAEGHLTAEQAKLATQVPMATAITAEADSGGHTDNRPALALFPTLVALRDQIQARFGYADPLHVGLAGGIASPVSAAAAFAMGAAYLVTGSVNQACIESGTSPTVRQMLAEAQQADIIMAPAADMFEMGVKVQVLKRGTMFAMRANKLYELYRANNSLESLPAKDRQQLEKQVFHEDLESIWAKTRDFFAERDPRQIERAERDPKHRMALVFRWYLGLSSHWANAGDPGRKVDYQIWCGPAMGAFNEWVKGSFLATVEERRVALVAHNILYGAALFTRLNAMRNQGYEPPNQLWSAPPLTGQQLEEFLH